MDTVERARIAMRECRRTGRPWEDAYQDAVLEAERARDREALAELSALAASRSLTDGEESAALAYLDFGLTVATTGTTRGHLLAVRSTIHLYAGRHADARAAIRHARDEASPAEGTQSWFELSVYESVIQLATLEDVDVHQLLRLALDARDSGYEWLHGGLIRWVVPWLFAAGRRSEASPWIALLKANALSERHSFRRWDARLFDAAFHPGPPTVALGCTDAGMSSEHRVRFGTLLLARDPGDEAALELLRVGRKAADVPADLRCVLDGVEAQAVFARGLPVDQITPPPGNPSLLNLAGALAGSELAAGDLALTRLWLDWFERLPEHVTTSLERPTAVAQLRQRLLAAVDSVAREHAERTRPRRRAAANSASQLTTRELDVLALLADAARYREVADKLDISLNTVQAHVRTIYRKLGASNRMAAVNTARTRGLLPQ